MKQKVSFGLKFIIGVMNGYINRHISKFKTLQITRKRRH